MSAKLETAMRGIDAFNRRDVDLVAELTTSDFAWFPAFPGTFAPDAYRGRDGMKTYFGEVADTWNELRLVMEEARDLEDKVLVLGHAVGRGRSSGVRVTAPVGIVFEFRGEKVSCCRPYLDPDEAVREVGYSE
jgi:ketosteroid isomerase-like protein